jgi:hypothetical protein
MNTVRLVRDFSFPADLLHQTPGGTGAWGNFQFTEEPVEDTDFLVILNRSLNPVQTSCPPERTWCLTLEPPISMYRHFRDAYRAAGNVGSPLVRRGDPSGWIPAHGSLPWHVQLSWDALHQLEYPQKSRDLSWITSNTISSKGHRQRMDFLEYIQGRIPFDLYGRGFKPVACKSQAHLDYRFSIVVENCQAPHYWTEKLMDSWLCWSFPFYFGATNIGDYFPEGSYLAIDTRQPDAALKAIRAKLQQGITRQDLAAMAVARKLVLDRYQLFPRMADWMAEVTPEFSVPRVPSSAKRTIAPVLDLKDRKTTLLYWRLKMCEYRRRLAGRWMRWTAR